MTAQSERQAKYVAAAAERQRHVDAVLTSTSRKKVVVAGPGTGKTHLFKQVVREKGKTLTLTFINALVDDLALELCGMSDVRTLHGFALSELRRFGRTDLRIFPNFSDIVREDGLILRNEDVDFAQLLHDDVTEGPHIEFYKERRRFYGHVYGMDSIVYALVQLYRQKPEKIPLYDQVVVDEFQDFNKLEVALIEQLASKSPVLLAGDDDQALYEFKSASAKFLRDRHANREHGFEPFALPYCSRCTKVIVGAANDIVEKAVEKGHLMNRVPKRFDYFDHQDKDEVSDQYPEIAYKQLFDTQLPWFITEQVCKLAEIERKMFDVLVISPTRDQARRIVEGMKEKGLRNVALEKRHSEESSSLASGLELLLRDRSSNLGWRLAAHGLLAPTDFARILEESRAKIGAPFSENLTPATRKEIRAALTVVRAVSGKKPVKKVQLATVASLLNVDGNEMVKEAIRERFVESSSGGSVAAVRRIPIRATTVQSSKGLSARYVFITHFDDFWFIADKDKSKISDKDICSFLVALTRATTKLFLVSAKKVEPTFLKWIKPDRIEHLA